MRVGISIDGAECDNTSRKDRCGRAVFDRIVRGVRLLIDSGHEVAAIAVISDPTPERARRLYMTVAELGCHWLGVNIEEQEGVNQRSNQHVAEQVQAFWAALAHVWHHDRRVRLRDIDRALCYATGVLDGADPAEYLVRLDPLPTIAHDGLVTLISPELAGFRSDRLGEFHCGNVMDAPLDEVIAHGLRATWVREYLDGISHCQRTCPYFTFCSGGQPANRYFEHGRLDGTHTNYCRNSKIALMEGVLTSARRIARTRRSNTPQPDRPARARPSPPHDRQREV
ncbi:MAG: radical SAM protein [Pseudonocardiales bacterium]